MTATERSKRRYARLRKSINRKRRAVYKRAKEAPSREVSQQRREASRTAPPIPDGMDLRTGDPRVAPKPEEPVAMPPAEDDRKSAIVTIRRKGRATALDMTPEEHQRRGDAADACSRR